MAIRSLTLLSEGMLSRSAKKALTIASIGWLVTTTSPTPPTSPDSYFPQLLVSEQAERELRHQRLLRDDQDILKILCTMFENDLI